MPNVSKFSEAIERNAARVKKYVIGQDGSNGSCDCIGLILGAMRLIGMPYSGLHGSNYFARNKTIALHKVTKASSLEVGQVVYKAKEPGENGYKLPSRYEKNPDQRDYYHIGYVTSVSPLRIMHCSAGGIHIDEKLGKWRFAGYIKGVDYNMSDGLNPIEAEIPDETGPAYVDVPNDGTVNIRTSPKGNAKIQSRIREGTTVTVLAFEGEWAKVAYTETGYVMNKFLREGEPK